MPSLRAVQEEMRRLIFFRDPEQTESRLWGNGIPDRLKVYRNNTRTNWSETLDCDFRLTKAQFDPDGWQSIRRNYFVKHPAGHWELNTSMSSFVKFLGSQAVKPYVNELADFEWHDLRIFIDRAEVKSGSGITNPTAVVRVYNHQMFFWVEDGAPREKPPRQKPEVLVFFRDSRNTSHIMEADPLMLLMMDHFRKPGARLEDLESVREKLLPDNKIPLISVQEAMREKGLLLV